MPPIIEQFERPRYSSQAQDSRAREKQCDRTRINVTLQSIASARFVSRGTPRN
jgi:hypothetical protein